RHSSILWYLSVSPATPETVALVSMMTRSALPSRACSTSEAVAITCWRTRRLGLSVPTKWRPSAGNSSSTSSGSFTMRMPTQVGGPMVLLSMSESTIATMRPFSVAARAMRRAIVVFPVSKPPTSITVVASETSRASSSCGDSVILDQLKAGESGGYDSQSAPLACPTMSLPISFLSDFGYDDEFVGVVHGVLATIAPESRVIDVAHTVARGDIRAGALMLTRSIQYLPRGV